MVVRFVYRNTVNPRLQAALAPKRADVPEDLQKDFLNDIVCVSRIVQQAVRQIINGLLIMRDQRLVCLFDLPAREAIYQVELFLARIERQVAGPEGTAPRCGPMFPTAPPDCNSTETVHSRSRFGSRGGFCFRSLRKNGVPA